MSSSPDFTPVDVPSRLADLAFSYLCPVGFHSVALPNQLPDFTVPTTFFALHLAMANRGLVLFSVGARPALAEGSVQESAEIVCRAARQRILDVKRGQVGGLPAVLLELIQDVDGTELHLRSAFIEDGKRLLNVSVVAPEALWLDLEPVLQWTLSSFRLAEPRGGCFPLMRSGARPADFARAETEMPTVEPSSSAELGADRAVASRLADLALADDAATLKADHPFNVRMRETGSGVVPRVVSLNLDEKAATVAAAAIGATVDLPFGWHAVDDGRRTLVFDAAGKIQISLNLRPALDGIPPLLQQIGADAVVEQPLIQPVGLNEATDLPGLVLRNFRDGNDILVRVYLARQVRDDELAHVARITSAPEESSRALKLAVMILRSLQVPVTVV